MATVTSKDLDELVGKLTPPVFSVYAPTHRTHPDNAVDPRVFGQLVGEFASVREQYAKDKDIQRIFERFAALESDYEFWKHTREGLAVFATRDTFDVYRLRRRVQPLAIVADSAHTKPLLKYLQTQGRYHLLVLSTNTAQLYEGDRYQLDEVDISGEDVPESMIDALDHEQRDLHATLAAYRTATGDAWGTSQNQGLRKTDIDNDIEQFFRAVDRAVMATYSVPSGLPLILAALPEHHSLFRRVSRNPQLLDTGVQGNAAAMDDSTRRQEAWQVFEPHYSAQLEARVAQFGHAASQKLGTDQIKQIAKDAYDGKVGTLLIEEDRVIPGRILDRDNVVFDRDGSEKIIDDVLDDLAELVMRQGGDVWVMPADRMPSETGAAAINRF